MKKICLLFLFSSSLVLFCSCKKDNSPSKTDLLTDHCWILSASVITPALNGVTDIYASMKPCEKDNTVCFGAGGTVTADEGALKCTVTDPQVLQGTWKFENGETLFKVTLSSGTIINAELLELSETILKIGINTELVGQKYYATQTYKPK